MSFEIFNPYPLHHELRDMFGALKINPQKGEYAISTLNYDDIKEYAIKNNIQVKLRRLKNGTKVKVV